MIIRQKHLSWLAAAFFVALIAVVFQQILTDMTEQGIASGGPYDNAASYPRMVAIFIAVLLPMQFLVWLFTRGQAAADKGVAIATLTRPALMLAVFAVYLALLKGLGYHLTTTPMIIALMFVAGMRNPRAMIPAALAIAFSFAFFFEFFLKIVLPGGVFRLNIPWG